MTYVGNLTGERQELYNRLKNFLDFKTSTDLEQRKVWNEWFKKFEKLDPPLAREFMKDVLEAQYKSHGEVWQKATKERKKR